MALDDPSIDGSARALGPVVLGERFRLERLLGEGGMGVVFAALDLATGERVALKTLRQVSPTNLERFKREFRVLADLSHPNLVSLYELLVDGREVFFTMELVSGVDLLEWVRGVRSASAQRANGSHWLVERWNRATLTEVTAALDARATATDSDVPATTGGVLNLARLTDAARQLATALAALHASGHLHRDVKPSNVLVTEEGRVVLLDFGIVAELDARGPDSSSSETPGTPAFMAPEAFEPARALSVASDWYAFGVLLYLSLTGRRPFLGPRAASVVAKRAGAVADPRVLNPEVPEELATLCLALLHPDPSRRPVGGEVLTRLGARAVAVVPRSPARPAFVGRDTERALLDEALREVIAGRPRALLVSGPSGIGKTALVESFLASDGTRGATILRGRCFERESVPHKALDSFVDALARHLATLPEPVVASLAPEAVRALPRMFPVLRRFAALVPVEDAASDVNALRRRAALELSALLRRLAKRAPLVVFIDDLHWGDIDSAPLLAELLTPTAPPLLWLSCFREEARASAPLLEALLKVADPATLTELRLAPLPRADLTRLVRSEAPRLSEGAVEELVEEAAGSAYFALELARAHEGSAGGDRPAGLEALIAQRAGSLSLAARSALDVVALAGGPISERILRRAIGGGDQRPLRELDAGRFTRASRPGLIECYHDRVRQTVSDALPPESRRRIHLAIAESLEAQGTPDEHLFALARHTFLARPEGGLERALDLSVAAGRRAFESFSFDQAHHFLSQALEVHAWLGQEPTPSTLELYGEVCVRTGRVETAARVLNASLARATGPLERASTHVRLARLRLVQLDTARCIEEVTRGLAALGDRPVEVTVRGVLSVLRAWWRSASLVRRTGYLKAIPGVDRARLSTWVELQLNFCVASYFRMDRRSLLLSLLRQRGAAASLGPSRELVRWMAGSTSTAAIAGLPGLARRLWTLAHEIAERLEDPVAMAFALEHRGHAQHFLGEVVAAERTLIDCASRLGEWLESSDYFTMVADLAWNSFMRGKPAQAWDWLQRAIQRAEVEGSASELAQGHTYRCYAGPVLAMLGRADEGRAHLDAFEERIRRMPEDRWRWGQYHAHRALFCVEAGELGAPFEDAVARFSKMGFRARSLPLQLRHFYVAHAAGRLAQRAADGGTAARRALAELDRAAGAHPTLRAHAALLRGRSELQRGRRRAAAAHLRHARALAARSDNALVLCEVALAEAEAEVHDGEVARERAGEALRLAAANALSTRAERARRLLARGEPGRPTRASPV